MRARDRRLLEDRAGNVAFEHIAIVASVALAGVGAWAALGDAVETHARCAARALSGSASRSDCAIAPHARSRPSIGELAGRTAALGSARDGAALGARAAVATAGEPDHPARERSPQSAAVTLRPLPPVMSIGFYALPTLAHLIGSLVRHHVARPIYIGTYGVDPHQGAALVAAGLTNARYSPMFNMSRSKDLAHGGYYFAARHDFGGPSDPGHAGVIPSIVDLVGSPTYEIVGWGRELGRRYRDEIRRHGHGTVSAWQLDEIWPSLAHPGSTPTAKAFREAARYFFVGVLDGLYAGRAGLEDAPMLGLVYLAHPNAFAKLATTATRRLLASLNRSTIRVIGEQYPWFRGDPRSQARASLHGQRDLWESSDPNARAIARKYIAGMTPGRAHGPGLGGSRRGVPARAWQQQYLAAHRGHVAGVGMFNWTRENSQPLVIDRVIEDVAATLPR